jgi:uncharacterized Zn finger protein
MSPSYWRRKIMSEEIDKFQIVCPACSADFDLDEAIAKGFDDERAEEYLKVTCPVCGCVRCPNLPEETD